MRLGDLQSRKAKGLAVAMAPLEHPSKGQGMCGSVMHMQVCLWSMSCEM